MSVSPAKQRQTRADEEGGKQGSLLDTIASDAYETVFEPNAATSTPKQATAGAKRTPEAGNKQQERMKNLAAKPPAPKPNDNNHVAGQMKPASVGTALPIRGKAMQTKPTSGERYTQPSGASATQPPGPQTTKSSSAPIVSGPNHKNPPRPQPVPPQVGSRDHQPRGSNAPQPPRPQTSNHSSALIVSGPKQTNPPRPQPQPAPLRDSQPRGAIVPSPPRPPRPQPVPPQVGSRDHQPRGSNTPQPPRPQTSNHSSAPIVSGPKQTNLPRPQPQPTPLRDSQPRGTIVPSPPRPQVASRDSQPRESSGIAKPQPPKAPKPPAPKGSEDRSHSPKAPKDHSLRESQYPKGKSSVGSGNGSADENFEDEYDRNSKRRYQKDEEMGSLLSTSSTRDANDTSSLALIIDADTDMKHARRKLIKKQQQSSKFVRLYPIVVPILMVIAFGLGVFVYPFLVG